MKTKKIVLGIAAVTIAAGAVFASTFAPTATNAEYRRSSDNQCVPITVNFDCEPGDPICKKPSEPDLNAQLHRLNSSCNDPLQPESGFN